MRNLILGIVLAIVAITLIIILFFVMPRQKSIMSQEIQTAEITIARLETENSYLKELLGECRGRGQTYSNEAPAGATGTGSSGGSGSLISSFDEGASKSSKGKTNTGSSGSGNKGTKMNTPNNSQQSGSNLVSKADAGVTGQQVTKNITRVLPSYYYGSDDEAQVTYCLMFGRNENRHAPALNPASFDPGIIKPNHLPGGGSNFYTDPVTGFIGDLGVTDKGVFFFSKELIDAFIIASDNGIVQLKAPATGWVPADLVYNGDGYYTWSPN